MRSTSTATLLALTVAAGLVAVPTAEAAGGGCNYFNGSTKKKTSAKYDAATGRKYDYTVCISSSGSYQAVAYVNRIPRGAASMGLGIYKGNSMVEDHPGGAARTGRVGPLKLTRSVSGRLNARLSFMDRNWKRVHYGNSPAR